MTERPSVTVACCANSTPLSKQAKSQAPQHKQYRANVTDKTNYSVGKKTEKTKEAKENIRIRERWWKTAGKINERFPADRKEVPQSRVILSCGGSGKSKTCSAHSNRMNGFKARAAEPRALINSLLC